MNTLRPIGLGNPDIAGKRSLFLPPKTESKPLSRSTHDKNKLIRTATKPNKLEVKRIRTTTELTPRALTILQNTQQEYRLRTGKVLPLWKVVSQAIEQYGQVKKKG